MSAVAVASIPFHGKSSLSFKAIGVPAAVEDTENRERTQRLDPESQLVERCLRGEPGAWDQLIQNYSKRVYGLCYRFTNQGSEAQDLTQEVFLRVFRTLGSFRAGEGCFAVWLTRLTRNLLVDHYRRTKRDRLNDGLEDKLSVLEERTAQVSRTDGLLAGREA